MQKDNTVKAQYEQRKTGRPPLSSYKKQISGLFLGIVMAFGVLSGCTQSGIDETIAPTEPVATVAQTAAPTEAPTEPATEPETEPNHQHFYVSIVIDPACTTNGYTTHECQCGDSYSDSEIAALGHEYDTEVIAPTNSAQGYTLYTCSVCGDSYKDNYTPKLPAATQPEETAPPIIQETQPREPEEVTPTTPSVTEPTETLPPATDPIEPEATAPDEAEHIHSYTSSVIPPTCGKKGYTSYICACGDSYTSDETAATGSHDYESTVVPPTASRRGYTLHTCKICGHSYKDNYVDKLPETEPEDSYAPEVPNHTHSWGEWIRHEDGWNYRICPECGGMDIVW